MRNRVGILALGVALLLVGCGGAEPETTAPAATTPPETAAPTLSPTSDLPTSEGALAEAATTAEIDSAAEAPDPSTFTSEFESDVGVIYVVYRLEEGAGGDVQVTWTHEGVTVNESSRTLPSDGTWAYEGFQAASEGFDPGDYEITLTVLGSGDSRVLTFVVN